MSRFGSQLQTNWDWRAACNFMFGGTGSAALVAGVLAAAPATPSPVVVLIALALVGIGLTMVWLEIGRPWRFLHVFFHPQASWMTREACVGTVLFPTTLAALALDSIVLYALAALLALLFLYCQARILKAAAGVPAWREPAIVPLIMFSGAVEGCALVVAASALADSAATWVIIALMVLLGVRVWSWFAYVDALRRAQAPAPALSVLQGIQREVLVFGTALPMALILASLTGIETVPALVLSSAVVIAVGWRVKHTIVIKAAYKQGYGVGKLRKGRPQPRVPVRRAGDPVQY